MGTESISPAGTAGGRSKFGGARVRVPPPLVFAVLFALGLFVHLFVHRLPVGLARGPRLVLGGALTVTSTIGGLLAVGQFRRSGRANPLPWYPSPALLVGGVYRFSRNPMYLFETIQMMGIGIATNCGWLVLLSQVFLVVVHYTAVRPEERYLTETFGEPYERYRAAVRRYL